MLNNEVIFMIFYGVQVQGNGLFKSLVLFIYYLEYFIKMISRFGWGFLLNVEDVEYK